MSETSQDYSITCDGAAFAYEAQTVVKNLSFSVRKGDYLFIVGENGSGKSTLIKGLLGLLRPACGVITRVGIAASEIGFLPQQQAAQKDFPASVFEVALSGRLGARGINPFYSRKDKEAAAANLAELGVANLSSCCFRELSGGQQQRVLLARALCASAKMIVLDEPASGLDPLVTADMYRILGKLNRERQMAAIVVSHDIQSAVAFASRILHLKNEQPFFATADEYRQSALGAQFLSSQRSKNV
ncbi:zinc ABC transporter ATP-binding protein [Campylobacterota bacterium]|nr:zinc ABC transporter ATP-binding protein [Campylobacterota bacterium]